MNFISLMRNFTIRMRMIGAIAVVLVLLALVGSAGLLGLFRTERLSEDFTSLTYTATMRMGALRTAIADVQRNEKDLVINYEKPAEIARYKATWTKAQQDVAVAAKALAESQHGAGAALVEEIAALMATHANEAKPVIAQLEASAYDTATVANRMLARAKGSMEKAEAKLAELEAKLAADAKAAGEARATAVNQTVLLFGAVVVAAIAIVIPLTLLNMVSICRPMEEAMQLTAAIAKGDLTKHIHSAGKDEAARMLAALEEMQNSLRSMVSQVRQSTDSITTASSEIAAGNQDLSGRTEQAASNLQQTASSMEQLTGTVKQTADSAHTANQLVSSASASAAKGGEVVSQVVSTMDDITASSKKISDIIGVIDGIAFQTNILALNAAVEAARAGEQGRGFAVVAGEVRGLAQRSAEAAKEIKSLIGASVERVETGSRLVQDAGSTMAEIVASVKRVNDIIGEITAAASEQSNGIGQVNTAVTQLDQMTQQNAALVEQSAAAAQSLKDQAFKLSDVVGRFKLSAEAAAAAAIAPRQPAKVEPAIAAAPKALPAAKPAPVAKAEPVVAAAAPAVPVAVAAAKVADDDWTTF